MSRITDDERRAVAAHLRHLCGGHPTGVFDNIVFDCLGLEYDGSFYDGIYRSESVERLADLIEPSCDRDALLELADGMLDAFEVGASSGEGIDREWCRELHDEYARRIREACRVGEGD